MNSNLLVEKLNSSLTAYSQSQQFAGYIYLNPVIYFLQKVDSVIDVNIAMLTLTNASGEVHTIDRKGKTLAEYFNIDFDNIFYLFS